MGGVVGSKMPHFSVFGDTVQTILVVFLVGNQLFGLCLKDLYRVQVNIAALMESTSEPMKIQISQTTQELYIIPRC